MGGLFQAALRRSDAGVEVPGAVHAPRSPEQLPAGRPRRGPGDVWVQGLRRRPQGQEADVAGGGVPASLRAARLAPGLREGAALRPVGQSLPGTTAASLSSLTV